MGTLLINLRLKTKHCYWNLSDTFEVRVRWFSFHILNSLICVEIKASLILFNNQFLMSFKGHLRIFKYVNYWFHDLTYDVGARIIFFFKHQNNVPKYGETKLLVFSVLKVRLFLEYQFYYIKANFWILSNVDHESHHHFTDDLSNFEAKIICLL